MKTLHVAPSDTAGGALRRAILDAGLDEEVLSYRDDLSCGPIDPDDHSTRASWWEQFYESSKVDDSLKGFWEHVSSGNDRLVVWFGRHSARELAFFLAFADRLGERSYNIVDVTGLRLPFSRPDGSPALIRSTPAVSIIPPEGLKSLVGSERPITPQERDAARRHWRGLKGENAPFRIVAPTGLISAPDDYFDPLLVERAATEWQMIARVISETMGYNSEPFMQVGDLMLLKRIVALVSAGTLLADGDPWDMRSCRVRLAT